MSILELKTSGEYTTSEFWLVGGMYVEFSWAFSGFFA